MNPNLPIYEKMQEIIHSVEINQVTIVVAATGAGKSTEIPYQLYMNGYKVYVTEPRRLAAINTSLRVGEDLNSDDRIICGYQTGFEVNKDRSTKILYCTDGLQLVRSITGGIRSDDDSILDVDEVHEWNINIETIIAWARKQMREGWEVKLVLMSATIDAAELFDYFNRVTTTNLIEVTGTVYPIEDIYRREYSFIPSIELESRAGREVMAFVPGKKEINETIEELQKLNLKAKILPLHGELDVADQQACFKSYALPRIIIATNVARTSITPDVDTIADMGLEKRIEVRDGIEGLYLCQLSKADLLQNRGRCGRTRDGRYILCSSFPMDRRSNYTVPEIQRRLLDKVVLQLMSIGIDPAELEFFHQPPEGAIIQAKKTLRMLGAIDDKNNVTEDGKRMSMLPMSTRTAKMIFEGNRLGVLTDVIIAASILEIGSLLVYDRDDYDNPKHLYSEENDSDLLAEIDVWKKICDNPNINFKEAKINKKNFFKIKDLQKKIILALGHVKDFEFNMTSTGNTHHISTAYRISMLDNIYCKSRSTDLNAFMNLDNDKKFYIDNKSIIYDGESYVIGIPRAIQVKSKYETFMKNIISFAEVVSKQWLKDNTPYLFSNREEDGVWYSEDQDAVVGYTVLHIGEVPVQRQYTVFKGHPKYDDLKSKFEASRLTMRREYETIRVRAAIEEEPIYINGRTYTVCRRQDKAILSMDSIYDLLSLVPQKNIQDSKGNNIEIHFWNRYYQCDGKNPTAIANNLVLSVIKNESESIKRNMPTSTTSKLDMAIASMFSHIGSHPIGARQVARRLMIREEDLSNIDIKCSFVCVGLDVSTSKDVVLLRVFNSYPESLESTQEALKVLFDNEIAKRCPERGFQFKIDGRWELTPKGRRFYNQYRDFMLECRESATIENISDMVEMTVEYYNESISELQSI